MNLADPEKQDGRRPHRGRHSDDQTILPLNHRQMKPRPHAFNGAMHKAGLFAFFPGEGLHDAEPLKHFVDHSQRGSIEGFRLP